jgi:alkanesulfonate monooxygenase SsuD/methylene tetrahydromethanopterin reductase-like flavin-dependent oxidoreductase (luciferase family)
VISCGNAASTIRRAATMCSGWMPAGLPAARMAQGVATLRRLASEAGRDPGSLAVTPQVVLSIDADAERAREQFRQSQVYEHLVSLRRTTLRNIDLDAYMSENLIGNPDEVIARVRRIAEAGADHLAGMIIAANSESELVSQARLFAGEVLPAFRPAAAR